MKKLCFLAACSIMIIGYAAVSTTLSINGNVDLYADLSNFNVYFSDARVDGITDPSVVETETKLVIKPDVTDGPYELEYAVTNASPNYEADVTVTCESSTSDVIISNSFDSSTALGTTQTRTGKLTVTGNVALKVGDEVTLADEKFNVVSIDGENMTVLAKYNLNKSYRQSSTTNYVKFASSPGWPYGSGPQEIDIFTYSTNPKTYVNQYVSYLKSELGNPNLTGDLITLKQLKSLGCTLNDDYTYSSTATCANSAHASWVVNGQYWWTKSSEPAYSMHIWYGATTGRLYHTGDMSPSYGVRPVITTTKVSPAIDATITCTITATPKDSTVKGENEVAAPLEPSKLMDPEVFCNGMGYPYGMYGANTYIASGWEEGDYDATVYLCAYDEDFEYDIDGYDIEGNLVYQYISDFTDV